MNVKYKLEKLNTEIKSFEGRAIAEFKSGGTLSYKKALISMCEMYQSPRLGTGDSFRAYDLGLRLLKAEDSLELDESDLKFLKIVVSQSRAFVSIVVGRVRDFLNQIVPIKGREDK